MSIPNTKDCPRTSMDKIIKKAWVYTDNDNSALIKGAVDVQLEGEKEPVRLFTFYPEELFFSDSEFIGITVNQSMALKRKKDERYLRR